MAYFLCAVVGSSLSAKSGTYVSFWLPAGLFAAGLLLTPPREWGWFCLAVLPANFAFDFIHDPSPNVSVMTFFYTGNVLQTVLGAWLVRRFVTKTVTLATMREFFGVFFFSGILGPMLGAIMGVQGLAAAGLTDTFFQTWLICWFSNVMAVVVFLPFLLAWLPDSERPKESWKLSEGQRIEATMLFGGMFLLAWNLLVVGDGIDGRIVPLLIFVMWAGLRFGLRGAALAVFLLALWMAFLTTTYLKGLSPKEIASAEYMLTLQIFMAVAAAVGLLPTVLLRERGQTMAKLRESEDRYRNLASAAFEGIVISENGRVVDVNKQCLQQFGCQREEMIGKELLDFVAPESRALAAAGIRDQRETIVEYRLLRLDGSTFEAEVKSKVMQLGDSSVGMIALRDITEPKRTETAMRESEEKFSKAFRASPDVIAITDLETGCYIEVNDAHEKKYGFKRAEVIGHSAVELGIKKDVIGLQRLVAALKAHEPVYNWEIEAHTRDGRVLTMLQNAELVEIGGRACALHVSRDITEQKRLEALRHSQRQVLEMIASGASVRQTLDGLLRAVEAQSPELLTSILLLDPDGVHLRHGAAPSLPLEYVLAIDGVTIGPRVGSCGTAAFRREGVFVADIASDPLWTDYKQLALPHELRACWSTPIFDAQKNVLGTFAIYHRAPGLPEAWHRLLIEMATQTAAVCLSKHYADESLKISEEALRASIENTPNVAVQWYDERGRVIFWNHASETMFGWSAAEAMGKTREHLMFTVEQAAGYHLALQKIMADGKPIGPVELSFLRRDGAVGFLVSTVFRIPVHTGELRFVCMDVDITERKKAEAEREQSVAREQAARIEYTLRLIASQESERKRIAAEIHDSLGQNLLLIKNLAHLVLREQKPEQTYERVASIDQLAAQCIAEARQISRDLHPQQLDHLGLERALEVLLENTATASGIKFTWKIDSVDELFTNDLAMNFYRIVQESLNNILKHSAAKKVRIELERDIHEVLLRITDDGVGYAADNPVVIKKGMGLRNLTERARMLGGTLQTISAPGKGTCITVTVPITADAI